MENCNRHTLLGEEHKMYIETYRHHFDLLAKATLIYFTATGAIGSYVFKESTGDSTKIFLLILISVLSIFGFLVSLAANKWVVKIEKLDKDIAKEISIQPFPFIGGYIVTSVLMGLTICISILGLIYVLMLKAT